ncbi:MAG: cobalamin biosynthesis protein CobW [Rhodospirillales bacterium]
MKIPATVITGFLGAGKTTTIRHMLANAKGRRIALVINEFGDLGIDRELVTGCGIEGCKDEDVVELANGCICCTVADDFLPTMEALLDRDDPPDHIVIETSGLALPKPLVKAFNWPEIKARVTVDGVVALIDAPAVAEGRFANDADAVQRAREADEALDHDSPLEEVFEDQIACADLVILNKSDLLDADGLDAVRARIAGDVPEGVKVVSASHGALDIDVLLGIAGAVEDKIEARWSHHDGVDGEHDHDDFDSFICTIGDVTEPADLEDRIRRIAREHDVLRVKGFVHVPGKDMRLAVQAVGGRVDRYFDRDWRENETRVSRLVVIGLHDFDQAVVTEILRG